MKQTRALLVAVFALASASARADFDSCLAGLQGRAQSAGVPAEAYARATRGLTPNDALGFLGAQPEFSTPIWDYLAGLVDEERVADGKAAMRAHAGALRAAAQRFGVDVETIVGVWGVESNFGKNFGWRPILQSLATLSCSPNRRQDYFRGEFISALRIVAAGDVDPAEFKGSWAGAFGHTQFMPSTFLRLAVDMDGDGRRDVISSVADAVGSTANFLRKAGWVSGQPWGFEVILPQGYSGPSGRGAKQPMASWAARGVKRADGEPLAGPAAGLLLPAGRNGPAFLVTRNFDALYAYNAAESYALAIAHLSDRLRGEGPFATPWPTDDPGLSREARREVQTLLMRLGYDLDGKADGVMGTKSRAAIADFQSRNGMARNGRASRKLLDALRGR
jgi:lytic murein transglycosylase